MRARGRVVRLPGVRQSVAAARRFLADAVDGCLDEDQLDTATLLVTEVVTNAVLHAQTDLSVHVVVDGSGVLVEVEDSSPEGPLRRSHSEESVTGRGLELVEGLADDYGVLATSNGKAVWFTLGGAHVPGPRGWQHWQQAAGDASPPVVVRLAALPLSTAQRLMEHNEGLLREYELHSHADAQHAARSGDAARAGEVLAAAVRGAKSRAEGHLGRQPAVDVDLEVPPGDLAAFDVLAQVLADAEQLAAAGEFLSRPAEPEVTALRDRVLREILAQTHVARAAAGPSGSA